MSQKKLILNKIFIDLGVIAKLQIKDLLNSNNYNYEN